jgi:hypothetical protein
METAPLRQE